MKKDFLKSAFLKARNALSDFHHTPSWPHPEVQEKLEARGFTFKTELVVSTASFGTFPPVIEIKDIFYNGQKIRVNTDDLDALMYKAAYKDAVAEYRQERAARQGLTGYTLNA